MFQDLAPQQRDPLLALIGLFREDGRADKVDLGVGVYRDEDGDTPVPRAVKSAELALWKAEGSKSYIGPEGDPVFLDLLWALVGGTDGGAPHAAGLQTPGGSGALRLACDLIARSGCRRIHLGVPSWPNHAGIFAASGLEILEHRYFDVATQTVEFDGMMGALETARPGDVVVLHASCHNPSGSALSQPQWRALAEVLAQRGVLPLVDVAYQGLGKGVEQDVAGPRLLSRYVPEMLVAVSCSKSFGLYRERVGAVYAVAASARAAEVARSNLVWLARVSYSMPPSHGAAVVRAILSDAALRREWVEELDAMRARIATLRARFAARLAEKWPALAAIAGQEGMFSLLPLDEAQIMTARAESGIYMPTSGRINVAGLRASNVDEVAERLMRL